MEPAGGVGVPGGPLALFRRPLNDTRRLDATVGSFSSEKRGESQKRATQINVEGHRSRVRVVLSLVVGD